MYRKVTVVSIIVLLLSLAFASVSFAQTGTGNPNDQQGQNNSGQAQAGNNQQGFAPGSAFTSLGQGRSVANGQRQWYAFEYAGDNSQIQIRLRNAANLMFSVWTQQQIQSANGSFGATADAVGRSTANNSQFGGDQYWTGSFNTPGTYYIMVERVQGGNTDNAAGNYQLEVTGSGVSWRGQGQGNANGSNNASGSNNTSGSNANSGSNSTSGSNNTSGSNANSGSNSTSGSSAQGGLAPSTLPTTGGETASMFPVLLGALGALSVTAGALLRRKK